MNPSVMLQKLIEIERSIGVETVSTTRRKVLDAQEYVLRNHWMSEENHHASARESAVPGKFYMLHELAKLK
jgi:hypothetical protein